MEPDDLDLYVKEEEDVEKRIPDSTEVAGMWEGDHVYPFTERMRAIIRLASDLAGAKRAIYPLHIFLASCKEATGVCGEMYLYMYKHIGVDFIDQLLGENTFEEDTYYTLPDGVSITLSTYGVFKKAREKMCHYHQTYINEGHIIQAILEWQSDNPHPFLSEDVAQSLIEITSVPRDMIVHLGASSWEVGALMEPDTIRKTLPSDLENLMTFVAREFGNQWLLHIKQAFSLENHPSVFIYEHNQVIIGFACFDIVRNKRGVFGPMGTSLEYRSINVGKALLYKCLKEMKEMGYEYAIIGEAGPIEFYEKVCQAQVIPKSIL